MRGIMMVALAWGAFAPAPAPATAPATAVAQAPPDSVLRQTTTGAIYHAANCAAPDARELLIIYLQGTGLGPEHSKQFLRHVGDRSGQCIVGVPYENTKLVASYCIADSTTGDQDPDCLGQVLGAKAAAQPSRVVTKTGGVLDVPWERSAEGAVLRTLQELELHPYLSADGQRVRWDRLILTGASQGAQVALYIALTRHRVAGVGSIVGGVLPTVGASRFPAWVSRPGKTGPDRILAYHHEDDADAFRREVYTAMRIPDENIRTTAVTGGKCAESPHPCVIIDDYLPMSDGLPKVVEDWLWVARPAY